MKAVEPPSYRVETRFLADPDERFYGLGHNQHGFLNQKGCVVELRQMNTQTIVPVLYSSRGYGFFWNNPACGRVELANNGTFRVADTSDQLDYFVVGGGSPSAVAREHKRRGLPMSVIVVDFFHWAIMGAWDFDPECWPDPEAMVRELEEMGIETMVSIWPTVNGDAPLFQEMLDRGYLVRADNNHPVFMRFTDTYAGVKYLHFVDFTNPDARKFVWEQARKNYYDRGVRLFWLDECEPEVRPYDNHNMRYFPGNGGKVSSLYPLYEEKAFYEGMKEAGEELPINLCRSAWAGSQKYGACVWSGDVFSDFATLSDQIKNGLNMAMAGIPWWTTDIGGFFGGNIDDPVFRELLVRWFQWGVFCPVFRLHGFRNSMDVKFGGDNEVWSFGDENYEILKEYLSMRERLRPYIKEQMKRAHETGVPMMRPLFYDFPEDEESYDVDDQLLFGPDVMAAPVVEMGARARKVYLPAGAKWTDAWSGEVVDGGRWTEADAPIDRIPVYLKDGAKLPITG